MRRYCTLFKKLCLGEFCSVTPDSDNCFYHIGKKMKPVNCVDENCKGSDTCSMCINRNIIAKKGFELIQLVEKIPASIEQTDAVSALTEYVKFCSKFLN